MIWNALQFQVSKEAFSFTTLSLAKKSELTTIQMVFQSMKYNFFLISDNYQYKSFGFNCIVLKSRRINLLLQYKWATDSKSSWEINWVFFSSICVERLTWIWVPYLRKWERWNDNKDHALSWQSKQTYCRKRSCCQQSVSFKKRKILSYWMFRWLAFNYYWPKSSLK